MRDTYNKTKKLHVNEQRETYSDNVDVEIYLEGNSYAEAGDLSILFDVEFEYRSWGVKGVSASLKENIVVPYTETDENDDETDKEVEVDNTKLKTDWMEGDSYSPSALDLYLKSDGTVDYEKSTLTFYYIKPD